MPLFFIFFFFNDTATTEIYTLSLHDALPILPAAGSRSGTVVDRGRADRASDHAGVQARAPVCAMRSEEHTSELQSQSNLVCRLLLEKKKKKNNSIDGSIIRTNLDATVQSSAH